jgi:hypothetical protein
LYLQRKQTRTSHRKSQKGLLGCIVSPRLIFIKRISDLERGWVGNLFANRGVASPFYMAASTLSLQLTAKLPHCGRYLVVTTLDKVNRGTECNWLYWQPIVGLYSFKLDMAAAVRLQSLRLSFEILLS